jgi:cell wall-associated NlpC family hydrolase
MAHYSASEGPGSRGVREALVSTRRQTTRSRVAAITTVCLLAAFSMAWQFTHASVAKADTIGQAIINAATSQTGQTYCWVGGSFTGPTHGSGNGNGQADYCGNNSTVGFDCSGLVMYALYQATGGAVQLPHNSGSQAGYGTVVSTSGPFQAGDVLFFGGSSASTAEHVGIFISGDTMIDANTAWGSYGDGTMQRSISGTEHALPLVGVRRFAGTSTATGSTAPSNGYEVAFQANTGNLWTVGTDQHGDWGLGMMPGTSPAITRLTTGGYEVAFQANTGNLWVAGAAGTGDLRLGMMNGTSPAITALPNGGYEVAFQANTGNLWTVGTDQHGDWGLGMMNGTSPAIAALPTGGYQVAFQANTGNLWVAGAGGTGDFHLGMMNRTSPAIAGLSGGYEVAFQANTGNLWTVGTDQHGDWGLGMMNGTSPALTN